MHKNIFWMFRSRIFHKKERRTVWGKRLGAVLLTAVLVIASLTACGSSVDTQNAGTASGSLEQTDKNTKESDQEDQWSSAQTVDLSNRDLDISPQLSWESSMELMYASGFAVDYYSDGYVLLSVLDGRRFLVVPEQMEAPSDLDEDIAILERPLDQIYLVASAAMDMFRALDAIDHIRFSGQKEEGWYIEEAKEAMQRGDMIYAGKYSAPDYELIVSEGCSLAIENTMISHSPEVEEKLSSFGVPVMIDYSSYESQPLGRVEWIRFYGALFGKEQIAEEAFLEQVEAQERAAEDAGTGKTVAFFYITTNGAVNVRKSADYVPKMIGLAGGTYIFEDLGEEDSKTSSMNMQMEEFYASAKDADYLIYNSTIDGELETIDELLGKSELLADFKAVREGNVWCTTKNLYQESMSIGTLIEDIHKMLTDADKSGQDMKYLYPLI